MLTKEQLRDARYAEWQQSAADDFLAAWTADIHLVSAETPGSDIRALLRNPDLETLKELAKHDPALAVRLRDDEMHRTAEAFAMAEPDYVPTETNMHRLLRHIARSHNLQGVQGVDDQALMERLTDEKLFTLESLRAAFMALTKQGRLQMPPGKPKALNSDEQRQVAAAIAILGPERGVEQYLRLALAGISVKDSADILVRFPDTCREASYFVFFASHAEAIDSPEFRRFVQERTRGRVIVLTVGVLHTLYQEFASHASLPQTEAKTEPEPALRVENLSDTEIAELITAERAARAAARRPRRIG